MIDGIEVWQCPVKEVRAETWIYLDLFHAYKNGIPICNSWLDMPIKVGEIIKVIESAMERLENAKH